MSVVLRLSLTSDEVMWTLVDECEQHVLDHDTRTAAGGTDGVVAAARSARSLASAAGLKIRAVRVTGNTGAPGDVVTALRSAGFDDVDVVALCAPARDCAPVTASRLEARQRRGLVATLAGVAAAAVLSVLFLTTGSVPQNAEAATTEPAPVTASGWVSVPAPQASTVTRKVVTPTVPARRVAAYTPAPVSAPPAAPAGPSATDLTGEAPWVPGPLMTDLSKLFTALP